MCIRDSSIRMTLNGNALNELSYDCEDSYFGLDNFKTGVTSPNPKIVFKESYTFGWNDTLSLSITAYFFDSTTFISSFTKEILLDFLNNRPSDFLIEIDLKMGDEHYRNFWVEEEWWEISNLLNKQGIDENAEFQISIHDPIRPSCVDYWEFIPLDISYKGLLGTKNEQNFVTINDMKIKFFLAEF